jgi:hypothetical protein
VTPLSFDIVVPTVGRPSLNQLLRGLGECRGPQPTRVLIVCDGADPSAVSLEGVAPWVASRCRVIATRRRGPAATRNAGWAASRAEWIVFLDDDVVPASDWLIHLGADLQSAESSVGGSQGNIEVPLPSTRPPTDWERNVVGLERARWATADMAYRRRVLEELGGFDERFVRAYREDAEFGLRVVKSGYDIVEGSRTVIHAVRPADRWVSVRLQSGNADDAMMRALHGRTWPEDAGAPRGRRSRHLVVAGAALVAAIGALLGCRRIAATGAVTWAAGTAELAWARISPGPRTADEVIAMSLSSAVLPLAATWHWVVGVVRAHRLVKRPRMPLQ